MNNLEQQVAALRAQVEELSRRVLAREGRQQPDLATVTVRQVGHGLAKGNAVRYDGTYWVKSQANTAANAAVGGIVLSVASPDLFILATAGYVTGIAISNKGVNYLSDSVAGALTITAPTIAVPVLMADSLSSGVLMALGQGGGLTNPLVVGSASVNGRIQVFGDVANAVVVDIDGSLVTSSSQALTIREIDVCDNGTAKKMRVIGSTAY